jgi:hypothetical protein
MEKHLHITDAIPAPKFVRIPATALTAALAAEASSDNRVGKGHIVTLNRLALYLWSDTVLEGTTAEWVAALRVPERNWQRHIPELAMSGVCRYVQPQRGYWRLYRFPATENEVNWLQTAWTRAIQQVKGSRGQISLAAEQIFLEIQASKMADGVIAESSSVSNPINHPYQATTNSSCLEGECEGDNRAPELTVTPGETSKRTVLSLPETFRNDLKTLGWVGSLQEIAVFYEQNPERTRAWLKYWLKHKRDVKNPAGIFLVTLRSEEPAPAPEPDEDDRRRYIEGKYADFIQH